LSAISMKELLEAGVHFGHQTRRWNPKMKRYIYGARNGIYIIDLHQTLKLFDDAQQFVQDTIERGGSILFVGTKKQAQDAVFDAATRCRQYYVNQRWLGGMLTNFRTIQTRIKRLEELNQMEATGVLGKLTKKEAAILTEERDKLERYLGGIKTMPRLPDAIFIVDLKKEKIALAEARCLEIPVVAIVDTNCDPDDVDYVIPGNDDAIRAIKLISNKIADAVIEVKQEEWDRQAELAASGEKPSADAGPVIDAADSVFLGDEEDEYVRMARLAEEANAAERAAASAASEAAAAPAVDEETAATEETAVTEAPAEEPAAAEASTEVEAPVADEAATEEAPATEAPVVEEAAAEAPAAEATTEAPAEAPADDTAVAPAETVQETPAETADAPAEAPEEAPAETPAEAPAEAAGEEEAVKAEG
jgi:small subunit ribosomal protein S2